MNNRNISAGHILAKQKSKKGKPPFGKKRVKSAAQELGSLGGQKGGPARAAVLPQKDLIAIARHAANVRWGNAAPGDPYK